MKNRLMKTGLAISFAMANFNLAFASTFEQNAKNDGVGGTGGAFELNGIKPVKPGNLEGNVTDILGVMQWIGFIVGIAMCMWIGIKYGSIILVGVEKTSTNFFQKK